MSVINQVLNDIEKRNEMEEKQKQDLFEPVEIKEISRLKYVYITIVVLFFILVGLSWWFFQGNMNNGVESKLLEQNSIHKKTLESEGIKKNIPSKVKTLNHVNSINKDAIKGKTITNISPTVIEKNKDNLSKEIIEAATQEPKKTIVKDKKIDIEAKPIVKEKETLLITPIEMTDDEVATLKLNQGIKEQHIGNIDKAQRHWQQALILNPKLHDARLQLAASFYGENETTKAIDLLLKATYQFPAYDGYRLLVAQIYYQQNELKNALSILNTPLITSDSTTENIVLSASLAQQLQQWQLSLSNYQILSSRDKNNAQWLLGVAIAYDALEQAEQAYNKYKKIMGLPNADNAIIEYAKQRITRLQNSIDFRGNNG